MGLLFDGTCRLPSDCSLRAKRRGVSFTSPLLGEEKSDSGSHSTLERRCDLQAPRRPLALWTPGGKGVVESLKPVWRTKIYSKARSVDRSAGVQPPIVSGHGPFGHPPTRGPAGGGGRACRARKLGGLWASRAPDVLETLPAAAKEEPKRSPCQRPVWLVGSALLAHRPAAS